MKGWALSILTDCEDYFACWADHLEESFSQKDDQFKEFCVLVKTGLPNAENLTETPELFVI